MQINENYRTLKVLFSNF